MNISVTCKTAEHCLKNSGLIERLQTRPNIQNVIIRHCMTRGLRFFVREEIGQIQHVAWLGADEVLEWTNTNINTHHQFVIKRNSNEGKIQHPKKRVNAKSSNLHRSKQTTTNTSPDGTGRTTRRKTNSKVTK